MVIVSGHGCQFVPATLKLYSVLKACNENIALFVNVIVSFNPLNAELNPICYLLALLAHHFLHVSRIRVKSLTLRLLMSYIWSAYS